MEVPEACNAAAATAASTTEVTGESLKPRDMIGWLRNAATQELARVINFVLEPLPSSVVKVSPSLGMVEVSTPVLQEPLPLEAVGDDGAQVFLPQVLGVVYKAAFDFFSNVVHFYSSGDPSGKFPAYFPSIAAFGLKHDKDRERQWVLHLWRPQADERLGVCCICSKPASTFFSVRLLKHRGDSHLMCGECIKFRPLEEVYDYSNPYIINRVALPSDETHASTFLM